MRTIKLSEIFTNAGTQIRASINDTTVEEYAEAMQDASNKFPPVVVFHDGNQHILADGFHRVMAAIRNEFKDIQADVRPGTKADALKYALGANAAHGLRRTNADKRRSVELALAEWPDISDREVARICSVDDHTVAAVRGETKPTAEIPQLKTRTGRDGKKRKMPARKATPTLKPAEPERPDPPTAPPAPPDAPKFQCNGCEAEFEDDSECVSLYECSNCGELFTQETSANGSGHSCPSCNKFGGKVSDMGCPECNEGEVEAVTTPDPEPGPQPVQQDHDSIAKAFGMTSARAFFLPRFEEAGCDVLESGSLEQLEAVDKWITHFHRQVRTAIESRKGVR